MEQYRLVELRDNIEKLMECPVCMDRLQSPVSCCYNGHPLCPNCTKSVGSCPLCQTAFTTGQNTFINQLIASFPFRCKFSIEGCEERAAPEYLTAHEKTCEYRYVDCPLLTTSSTACYGLVSVRSYAAHVEEHHQSYITTFTGRDWGYSGVLPKTIFPDRLNCYYSILKDSWKKLYFVVMIYYEKISKAYQISVHYLGRNSEASNYIYTIKIMGVGRFNKGVTYSGECVPNMMSPEEASKYEPFEVKDTNGRISQHKNETKFFLSIKKVDDFNKNNPHSTGTVASSVSKKRKTLDELMLSADNHKTGPQLKEVTDHLWVPWQDGFPAETL